MKIYTKTGDQGTTGLFNGDRVLKTNCLIESYGTLDELNSSIGVAVSFFQGLDETLEDELETIQKQLFHLGADLVSKQGLKYFQTKSLNLLETWIDERQAQLPPLRNFILASGDKAATHLHLARCICRRAERIFVSISKEEDIDPVILAYLNRLSDYLFVAARSVNVKKNILEKKVIFETSSSHG